MSGGDSIFILLESLGVGGGGVEGVILVRESFESRFFILQLE